MPNIDFWNTKRKLWELDLWKLNLPRFLKMGMAEVDPHLATGAKSPTNCIDLVSQDLEEREPQKFSLCSGPI